MTCESVMLSIHNKECNFGAMEISTLFQGLQLSYISESEIAKLAPKFIPECADFLFKVTRAKPDSVFSIYTIERDGGIEILPYNFNSKGESIC